MAFQIEPNIILLTDSYKVTHWKQLPPGTTFAQGFFESRGGRYDITIPFGLQAILLSYFVGSVVTELKIREAKALYAAHFGNPDLFNERGWRHILDKHNGHLPLLIKAIPEGTRVPVHNALITVENTDPEVPWLPNYMETLLVQTWYAMTVATQSWHMRQDILRFLEKTGDPGLIDFKLHDFGFRGVSSVETAGIGAAAHLLSFKGTDTVQGLRVASTYYDEPMAGFSIPAAEHFTITSWGREQEVEAYRNMLTQFPTGTVAVVSDSFNVFDACERLWGQELRDQIVSRDGMLVIRPDSGDPVTVLCKIMAILAEQFGDEPNAKGYRVIHPKVRVIQGDGIDYQSIPRILGALEAEGWSADNLAFGSGGGLLQMLNRDTQKMAFKCCAVDVNGEQRDVLKDPITDPGKKSKAGRLALVRDPEYRTVREQDATSPNLLVPVFLNGELLVRQTFAEIRARALQDDDHVEN